jgi:hypothetical protein
MAYYLTSGPSDEAGQAVQQEAVAAGDSMADMRVFWGPDICRLEYLLHLVDTGRIKDESFRPSVPMGI